MKMTGRLNVSLIVCLALTLATDAMAQMPEQAKAPTPQTQNVNVVNTPNVTGTVSANQSGNWTMGLTPGATVNVTSSESDPLFVKPAPQTTKLVYKALGMSPGCGFDATPTIDVSAYSQIRPYSRVNGSCNSGGIRMIFVNIDKDTGISLGVLAALEPGVTEIFDLPGESLQVVMEQSVTQCCSIDLVIYGR